MNTTNAHLYYTIKRPKYNNTLTKYHHLTCYTAKQPKRHRPSVLDIKTQWTISLYTHNKQAHSEPTYKYHGKENTTHNYRINSYPYLTPKPNPRLHRQSIPQPHRKYTTSHKQKMTSAYRVKKQYFIKYYLRYTFRYSYSIIPSIHTRLNTIPYSRIRKCTFYCMKYKYSMLNTIPYTGLRTVLKCTLCYTKYKYSQHAIYAYILYKHDIRIIVKYTLQYTKYKQHTVYIYKHDIHYTHGHHPTSKSHPKSVVDHKLIPHSKHKVHSKYGPQQKYILHSKHKTHLKHTPHPQTKLHQKPRSHPKNKSSLHKYTTRKNNTRITQNLNTSPKPKPETYSKYNIHPQPHSKHNYHINDMPQQLQYIQLHTKAASAYRPRHREKT